MESAILVICSMKLLHMGFSYEDIDELFETVQIRASEQNIPFEVMQGFLLERIQQEEKR